MALSREERKLLHQKATQPTFGNNKPDDRQGNDGDISYRRVEGSGLVQFVKKDGKWNAVGATGNKPASRVLGLSSSSSSGGVSNHGSLTGLSADDHKQYLLISGSRAMSGNLSLGGNDIGSVGALDVDGHTTLDQVTINTTDGAFAVSGANAISLTTTGSNDINLTSGNTLDVGIGFDYELDVARTCDWNTGTTDWDNSSTFALTSLGDTTIETLGTPASPKTLSIISGKSDFSKYGIISIEAYNKITESGDVTTNHSANGIQLIVDADDTAGKHNNILIQQKNQGAKGSAYGINLKSENGIKIETDNNAAGQTTAIIAQATGTIDIGLTSTGSSLSPNTGTARTKIHGVFDCQTLFRDASTGTKHTDTHYPINTSTHNVKFDQIDTFKLLRATTFLASDSSLAAGSALTIVAGTVDDNIEATVWRVTIYWNHSSSNRSLQIWHCYATTAANLNVVKDVEELGSGAAGTLTWTSGDDGGIKWTNNHASQTADVKASALKIQSGNDF